MAQMANTKLERSNSISQASENSQTAQEFINSQLQLEAEAREALPYQFDTCTRPLGPLRQALFSCLTCNPPPKDPQAHYRAAGVCYSCSISCHGEHELVELFNKRNFVCDCGTTRLPSTSPCSLRINEQTGTKGDVRSETPAPENKYNHNFRNNFCTCGEVYNAQQEQGTMFQCLGIGTVESGGCGEDWYHPECLMGLPRTWRDDVKSRITEKIGLSTKDQVSAALPDNHTERQEDTLSKEEETADIKVANADRVAEVPDDGTNTPRERVVPDHEDMPPGFPEEDDFEDLICYKCVDANPWIKKYANSTGFQAAITHRSNTAAQTQSLSDSVSRKRKASPDEVDSIDAQESKRSRGDDENASKIHENKPMSHVASDNAVRPPCLYEALPTPPAESVSLFTKEDFRSYMCRCANCYPRMASFRQLLEEEETYEPPVSEDGDDGAPGSLGSRSLLDRGEAALSNMDRVRAIEGVMVYNHLKDKVKSFLKPFAESGQAVGAEDIKKYFEGLRGDSEAISAASRKSNADDENDNRREQSGY